MKKRLLTLFAAMGFVSMVLVPNAFAYDPLKEGCSTEPKPAVCNEIQGDGKAKVDKTVTNVIDILLYVLGIISVIMIVVGGIKYTTSNGDSSAVTSAKNTILYAVVGLVVAIMAFAIVNFVINRI